MTKTIHLIYVLLPVIDVDGVLQQESRPRASWALFCVLGGESPALGSGAGPTELGDPRVFLSAPSRHLSYSPSAEYCGLRVHLRQAEHPVHRVETRETHVR